MPITHIHTPEHTERLEPDQALATALRISKFPAPESLAQPVINHIVDKIIAQADTLNIPVALVFGLLRNTPADPSQCSTFDQNSKFELLSHQGLTLLPCDSMSDTISAATPLCQIVFHARKYIGPEIAKPYFALKTGALQAFLTIHYAEFHGIFELSQNHLGAETISPCPELGPVLGKIPSAPLGVSTKLLLESIGKMRAKIQEIECRRIEGSSTLVNHIPFVVCGKNPGDDVDALQNFTDLEFVKLPPLDRGSD